MILSCLTFTNPGNRILCHTPSLIELRQWMNWSWMQHFVGGLWRRVLVIIAGDMDSLIDASGALGEVIEASPYADGLTLSNVMAKAEAEQLMAEADDYF